MWSSSVHLLSESIIFCEQGIAWNDIVNALRGMTVSSCVR
jgi:hypothetical protein